MSAVVESITQGEQSLATGFSGDVDGQETLGLTKDAYCFFIAVCPIKKLTIAPQCIAPSCDGDRPGASSQNGLAQELFGILKLFSRSQRTSQQDKSANLVFI